MDSDSAEVLYKDDINEAKMPRSQAASFGPGNFAKG